VLQHDFREFDCRPKPVRVEVRFVKGDERIREEGVVFEVAVELWRLTHARSAVEAAIGRRMLFRMKSAAVDAAPTYAGTPNTAPACAKAEIISPFHAVRIFSVATWRDTIQACGHQIGLHSRELR